MNIPRWKVEDGDGGENGDLSNETIDEEELYRAGEREDEADLERKVEILERMRARRGKSLNINGTRDGKLTFPIDLEEVIGVPFPVSQLPRAAFVPSADPISSLYPLPSIFSGVSILSS